MALPTLIKTWNYDVNSLQIGTSRADSMGKLAFKMKDSLKNFAGWSVIASSNFSSVGTSDLWSSSSSAIYLSYSSSNRSWIILQHPINLSQILIYCGMDGGGWQALEIYYSQGGYSTSGISTQAKPSTILNDEKKLQDSYGVFNSSNFNSAFQFVSHAMKSSDGYCYRQIIYKDDFPVFFLLFDAPETDYANVWAPTSPAPSIAMVIGPTNGNTYNVLSTNVYTSANLKSKIGPIGSFSASTIDAYLSGEAYNGTLLTNGLAVPNDFTGEYPILEIGIVSATNPFSGKIGKISDLWFGVNSLLSSITYPDDNSRQLAQHGTIITPWNGSVMLTR